MARVKLPSRRSNITTPLKHTNFMGVELNTYLTFGIDDNAVVKEVFCADPQQGSDIQAILVDACVLISLHLQTGAELEKLSLSLGENRGEGQNRGPPASIIGSIVAKAIEVQKGIMEEVNET